MRLPNVMSLRDCSFSDICASTSASLLKTFISCPPKIAVIKAVIGRKIAKVRPISEYVARMESTPVCGVAIRKETVAPFDAPSRRNDMAVGMTPHEQRGNGTPKSAALKTEAKLFFAK